MKRILPIRLSCSFCLLAIMILLTFGAGPLRAEDTDIYGSYEVSVPPNVLIIFDNSGSMDDEIASEEYDSATTYSGSYTADHVYVYYDRRWRDTGKTTSTICQTDTDAIAELTSLGYARMALRSDGTCGRDSLNVRLGNFMNYSTSTSLTYEKKLAIAKTVVKEVIDETSNVNFGLMVFNSDQGGRIVVPVADSTDDSYDETTFKTNLKSKIDALTASTWTPLAETLAEAGLYYAGKNSYFNSGTTYTSPIMYRCQKNYVIIMTDGAPTQDQDQILYKTGAYMGSTIGDLDADGNETSRTYDSYGSDYLDDVAKFLYDNDLRTDMGSEGDFLKQNIITYTIGFAQDLDLLEETAENGGAEEGYITASNVSTLKAAFKTIFGKMAEVNSVFVSPVVPVSQMNKTYSGDRIYIGFFKPEDDGRWSGNIKKYAYDEETEQIIDADGNAATDSAGEILPSARSYWSTEDDGPTVIKGGVGAILLDNVALRNLYTNLATSPSSLTLSANKFATDNTELTYSLLGVADDTEKDEVITDIIGTDRTWILGDILHSEPAVVLYDTDGDGDKDANDDSFIFVGSNDGMMHCFRDSDGMEVWGFIPADQLERLQNLSDATVTHDYFVDGVPTVFTSDSSKILFFGERRGGSYYHGLDVTTPALPSHLYTVAPDILGSGAPTLGQSWGTAVVGYIMTSTTTKVKAILLPGGYDVNQDEETPASSDTYGKAMFAIKASDGTLLSNFKYHSGNNSDMTHSIVDINGQDTNEDGAIDRIYAGDMNGQIFGAKDDSPSDGSWGQWRIFKASSDGYQRKIFGAPDIVTITSPVSVSGAQTIGDMIFFGTGDRENPTEKPDSSYNRFYAIKNYWDSYSRNLTVETTRNDDYVICDATDDALQMGTTAEKQAFTDCLERSENRGWYFDLENKGEKMIGSPVVYDGVVYFTTYTPDDSTTVSTDPCGDAGARGVSRLYAVDYLTGSAVINFQSATETDGDGNSVGEDGNLSKGDRSKTISGGMASEPIIAVYKSGAKVIVGGEGGVQQEDAAEVPPVHIHYWRQMSKN